MRCARLTRQLVDLPSVTGDEKRIGEFLLDWLRREGWTCLAQEVAPERFNVLATRGTPQILLTTHMDTVPPFFPSQEDDEFIYGRGACDAKGIAAAMITAAGELVAEGMSGLGLLFVVGEETDSAGAQKARELDLRCAFLIDGEPTDNELVTGHKGIVYARVRTRGVLAHSACPEKGDSAIEKLLEILERVKKIAFPTDDRLGKSLVNIGTLRGGRAANVIADEAEAEILIRSVAGSEGYVGLLQAAVGNRGSLEILRRTEPQVMESVEGFPTRVVGYGTDIPALRALGRPLLFGPGSISEAHTAREKVSKQQLADAVHLYKVLVKKLKAGLP